MDAKIEKYSIDVAAILPFDKIKQRNEIVSFLLTQNDLEKVKNSYPTIPQFIVDNVLSTDGFLLMDLLIQSVAVNQLERYKLVPYIGDWFDVIFFGAQPTVININGYLLDLADSLGKDILLWLYENILRVSAVAKLNISPIFQFRDLQAYGFITTMNVQEDSHMTDILKVSMSFVTGEIIQVPVNINTVSSSANLLSLKGDRLAPNQA